MIDKKLLWRAYIVTHQRSFERYQTANLADTFTWSIGTKAH